MQGLQSSCPIDYLFEWVLQLKFVAKLLFIYIGVPLELFVWAKMIWLTNSKRNKRKYVYNLSDLEAGTYDVQVMSGDEVIEKTIDLD